MEEKYGRLKVQDSGVGNVSDQFFSFLHLDPTWIMLQTDKQENGY